MGTREDQARYRAKMAETHRWGKTKAVKKEVLIDLVRELSNLLGHIEPFLANNSKRTDNVAEMMLNIRIARQHAEAVLHQDRESKINRWHPKNDGT